MKIVSVVPAGRKRFLEILCQYILKNRHVLDEHHFWLNTTNDEDRNFIFWMANKHPDFFKVITVNLDDVEGDYCNSNITKFYEQENDIDTVYLRLDDDICW